MQFHTIPLDLRTCNATILILCPVFGYVPEDGPLFTFKTSLIYFHSKANEICYIMGYNFYLQRKNEL